MRRMWRQGGRAGRIAAVLLGISLPLAVLADRGETLARGQAEFEQYCASCHGLSGRGDGPLAVSLMPPPSDLTALGARYGMPLPRPKLVGLIDGRQLTHAHGNSDMPVWGKQLAPGVVGPERTTLVRGTLLVIVEFIESIQATPLVEPES